MRFVRTALLFTLFLPACATLSTPRETVVDPCTLVTREEAAAVRGEPFVQAEKTVHADASFHYEECFFQMTDPAKSFTILVATGSPADTRQSWAAMFRGHPERESEDERFETQRVHFLGDDARWNPSYSDVGALFVLRGNTALRIVLAGTEPSSTRRAESRRLAKLALARMK